MKTPKDRKIIEFPTLYIKHHEFFAGDVVTIGGSWRGGAKGRRGVIELVKPYAQDKPYPVYRVVDMITGEPLSTASGGTWCGNFLELDPFLTAASHAINNPEDIDE